VIAAAVAILAIATVVIAADEPAPQVRAIGETSQPATGRYFDIEANKAASMRALGQHIAAQQLNRVPPYRDLESNKARSRRAG
jgi:hypothetical protein